MRLDKRKALARVKDFGVLKNGGREVALNENKALVKFVLFT